MEWVNRFGAGTQPSEREISEFINNPLWENLNAFLQESYEVEPVHSYSTCSGQPGWNVKYKKAGRALCALYPMPGYFIALVVIGAKEQQEVELTIPACTEYMRGLFTSTVSVMGGRWLMIHVTDEAVLDDVKTLIQTRRKIKRKDMG